MQHLLQYVRDRWFLLFVLVVFIILKYPHLSYPFYWDESWPYATAVHHMYYHGVSLMPNAINAEISRGHPLFFHAAAAIWMHIFGTTNFSLHAFALFISILVLIAVYEAGLRVFNKRVAVLSLILIATQVIFFVQSSFLLLEMLVALLGFLSFYYYVCGKYFLTALVLSMLFLTKESGLIVGFVIGLDALIELFNKNNSIKTRLYKITAVAAPVLVIIIYFLVQYKVQGWLIFPFYKDQIVHWWGPYWDAFRLCLTYIFYDYYGYIFYGFLLLLVVIATVRSKNKKLLAIFIPACIIACMVYKPLSDKLYSRPVFVLFIITYLYFIYSYMELKIFSDKRQQKMFVYITFFLLCFCSFSSANFFIHRYLLVAIIPFLFIVSALADKLMEYSDKRFICPFYAAVLTAVGVSFLCIHKLDDCNLGAYDGMKVYQSMINYLEKHNDYNKIISATNFQHRVHLTDPYTGYLSSNRIFTHVKYEMDTSVNLALFDNIEPDTNRYRSIKNDEAFHIIYRVQKGIAWGEVYEKNK